MHLWKGGVCLPISFVAAAAAAAALMLTPGGARHHYALPLRELHALEFRSWMKLSRGSVRTRLVLRLFGETSLGGNCGRS